MLEELENTIEMQNQTIDMLTSALTRVSDTLGLSGEIAANLSNTGPAEHLPERPTAGRIEAATVRIDNQIQTLARLRIACDILADMLMGNQQVSKTTRGVAGVGRITVGSMGTLHNDGAQAAEKERYRYEAPDRSDPFVIDRNMG